ncbi:hypothetical protein [Orenia marismortui]|uniref:Uncharacterized protein n=1 Tax=Orenia marismortui TaxID=46469 RepID=A0A4R8GZ40_9FIRM|nr:hypothetical protein [Orenia marismortui]TDX51897.1 hypothetical protein C7959_10920 [Orenia marismortui]
MKDVISLEYNLAKELLEVSNYEIKTRYTRPTRKLLGLGQLRVVGQRLIDETTIELIISHEDYQFGLADSK